MDLPLEVRRAIPDDAGTLARLRYALRTELDSPQEVEMAFVERCSGWMAERLRAESWLCWIACTGDVAVGTLWLQLIEKIPNPVGHLDFHGYISSVYVVPRFRNAGIGSALLEACISEADSRPLDALFLWPTELSRPLYRRYGFSVRDDLLERRLSPTSRPG